MAFHYCKCANNQSGLCYGKDKTAPYESLESWHQRIAEARYVPGSTLKLGVDTKLRDGFLRSITEVDCPGYTAVGGAMYGGATQGDIQVPPFN